MPGKDKPNCNKETSPLTSKGPLGTPPVPLGSLGKGLDAGHGCQGLARRSPGCPGCWRRAGKGRRAPPSIWGGSASPCSCEISLQALESTSKIFLSILLLQSLNDSASLGWQVLRASPLACH